MNVQNLANLSTFKTTNFTKFYCSFSLAGDFYNVVFFNEGECRCRRVSSGKCTRARAQEEERKREREVGRERERQRGFYRDCCNSITVTRDARIGNVTNHETWLRLFARPGCRWLATVCTRELSRTSGVSLDSGPRNEEFNDIVDVHVGHVDAPRVAVSLFYFDVSLVREILFWTRVFIAEELTRPLVKFVA